MPAEASRGDADSIFLSLRFLHKGSNVTMEPNLTLRAKIYWAGFQDTQFKSLDGRPSVGWYVRLSDHLVVKSCVIPMRPITTTHECLDRRSYGC